MSRGLAGPIPGSRMKMRDAYLVPLSDQALALLEELHTHMRGRQCLFRNYRIRKTRMSATISIVRSNACGSAARTASDRQRTDSGGRRARSRMNKALAQMFSSVSSPMPNETKHGQATTRLNILTISNSCCSMVLISSTTFRVPCTTLHIRSFGGMTRSEIPTP